MVYVLLICHRVSSVACDMCVCDRCVNTMSVVSCSFFFQAEDGIRDLVRSRGLGDVYKRQAPGGLQPTLEHREAQHRTGPLFGQIRASCAQRQACLLYTSDAADERSSVDLGGRRIIKKKKCTVDSVNRRETPRSGVSQ